MGTFLVRLGLLLACSPAWPAPPPAATDLPTVMAAPPAPACEQRLRDHGIAGTASSQGGFCYVATRCPLLPGRIAACQGAVSRLQLDRLLAGVPRAGTPHVAVSIPEEADRRAFIALPADLRSGFLSARFPPLSPQQSDGAWSAIDAAIEECQRCGACVMAHDTALPLPSSPPRLLGRSRP